MRQGMIMDFLAVSAHSHFARTVVDPDPCQSDEQPPILSLTLGISGSDRVNRARGQKQRHA